MDEYKKTKNVMETEFYPLFEDIAMCAIGRGNRAIDIPKQNEPIDGLVVIVLSEDEINCVGPGTLMNGEYFVGRDPNEKPAWYKVRKDELGITKIASEQKIKPPYNSFVVLYSAFEDIVEKMNKIFEEYSSELIQK